jgi:hypothetical protein
MNHDALTSSRDQPFSRLRRKPSLEPVNGAVYDALVLRSRSLCGVCGYYALIHGGIFRVAGVNIAQVWRKPELSTIYRNDLCLFGYKRENTTLLRGVAPDRSYALDPKV